MGNVTITSTVSRGAISVLVVTSPFFATIKRCSSVLTFIINEILCQE